MLNKVDVNNPVENMFKLGDVVFKAGEGLYVFLGKEDINVLGDNISTLNFANATNPSVKIKPPVAKVSELDLRPVPSVDEVMEMFSALSAKSYSPRWGWKKRTSQYEAWMKDDRLSEIAKVIHTSLSKFRSKSKLRGEITDVPDGGALSYSERMLVKDAVQVLAPVLQFRCGLSEVEAIDALYRAVIEDGSAAKLRLKDKVGGRSELNNEVFKRSFGVSRRKAGALPVANLELKRSIFVEPEVKTRTRARDLLAEIDGEEAALKKQRASGAEAKKVEKAKTDGRGRRRSKLNVNPSLKEEFDKLYDLLPSTPHAIGAFKLAAKVLNTPEDLRLVTKLWLAHRDKKSDIQSLAAEFKQPAEMIVAKAKDLAERMRKAGEENGVKAMQKIKLTIPRIGA